MMQAHLLQILQECEILNNKFNKASFAVNFINKARNYYRDKIEFDTDYKPLYDSSYNGLRYTGAIA